MFLGSNIEKNFSVARTNYAYVQTCGIFTYFLSVLKIEHSNHHSISFGESMNKITQKEQMDIAVKFFNKSLIRVDTIYFTYNSQ